MVTDPLAPGSVVSRRSSILGLMAGGRMLTMNWGIETVFEAVAVPGVIAAIAVMVMKHNEPGRPASPLQTAGRVAGRAV